MSMRDVINEMLEEAREADRARVPFRMPWEPLTAEHLEARRQVLKQAENEPDSFAMGSWEDADAVTKTGCTTTRCMAGWAQFFLRGEVDLWSVERDAVRAMGLSEAEYYGDDTPWPGPLFYMSDESALDRLRRLCTAAAG